MARKINIGVIILFILMFVLEAQVNACTEPIPEKTLVISETHPWGSVLYTMTVDPTIDWSYVVNSPSRKLEKFFLLSAYGNVWNLRLMKVLDMESVFQEEKDYWRRIRVLPVDEFPPVFPQTDMYLNVPEGTMIGIKVLDIDSAHVTDQDVQGESTPNKHRFSAQPNAAFEKMFLMDEYGGIFVAETADYETGHIRFDLNVTVMGAINDFTYGPINAIDIDNDEVRYRIIQAAPATARAYVEVESLLGQLSILRALRELNAPVVSFVLEAYDKSLIKASYGFPVSRSEYTLLIIYVQPC